MSTWDVTATNTGGGDNESPPEGNHPAVLIGLIDIGTHEDEYNGQQTLNHKILLCWELTAEHKADGSPFVVCADFNLMPNLSKKSKLRGLLEGWRGKPLEDQEAINLATLIGRPCLINIVQGKSAKGNVFAKIDAVKPPIRGMTVPKPLNDPFIWNAIGTPFPAPSWLPYLYGRAVGDHIAESREARGLGNGQGSPAAVAVGAGVDDDGDEVPF